jgi:hypothetical protein
MANLRAVVFWKERAGKIAIEAAEREDAKIQELEERHREQLERESMRAQAMVQALQNDYELNRIHRKSVRGADFCVCVCMHVLWIFVYTKNYIGIYIVFHLFLVHELSVNISQCE